MVDDYLPIYHFIQVLFKAYSIFYMHVKSVYCIFRFGMRIMVIDKHSIRVVGDNNIIYYIIILCYCDDINILFSS